MDPDHAFYCGGCFTIYEGRNLADAVAIHDDCEAGSHEFALAPIPRSNR